ncbi:Hpt domain-containing protein [Thiocapsa roseopersicina]|uniref:Two-component system, NarL family, sensor histidine kinase BarA n=1 Tax=Thiocapsa roseopersicina TaxID=1058 RepID=A0A1H2YYR8_THIRO|nr:Hpt domain-containing protein [Thiocapsa roseopersicina]SDX10303.1 two-component system, NarL family, sensor histidine kinase BarA [Thiocapsa roseopersicina]
MIDQRSKLDGLPARDDGATLASAGGDADLARELLDVLLAGLPAEIEELRACIEEGDWSALAEHAHQVRGATRYCGVPALDEAIEALERTARRGDPVLVSGDFDAVESQARRLVEALRG